MLQLRICNGTSYSVLRYLLEGRIKDSIVQYKLITNQKLEKIDNKHKYNQKEKNLQHITTNSCNHKHDLSNPEKETPIRNITNIDGKNKTFLHRKKYGEIMTLSSKQPTYPLFGPLGTKQGKTKPIMSQKTLIANGTMYWAILLAMNMH